MNSNDFLGAGVVGALYVDKGVVSVPTGLAANSYIDIPISYLNLSTNTPGYVYDASIANQETGANGHMLCTAGYNQGTHMYFDLIDTGSTGVYDQLRLQVPRGTKSDSFQTVGTVKWIIWQFPAAN